MATSGIHCSHAGENPWRQNERLIKRLYQDERKTLEEVKQTMETVYNFPQIPLSTWESKLRDVLRLRKKLKKDDWPTIYSHILPRREQGKETAIYLNGTLMPWKKTWKEMRRSGTTRSAHAAQRPLAPLPRGVLLRTPSPVQSMPVNNAPSVQPLHTGAQADAVPSTNAQPMSLENPQPISEAALTGGAYNDTFYRLCLESTPFVITMKLLAPATSANTVLALGWQWPAALPHHHNSSDLGLYSSTVDLSGSLGLAVSLSHLALDFIPALRRVSLEISTNFDVYYHLAMAVYVLPKNDNKRLYTGDGPFFILELLFCRVSYTILTTFLQRDCPSMKAAWERLVRDMPIDLQNKLERHLKSLVRNLMEFGLHNDWIDIRMGHTYLYFTVKAGCADIVWTLLRKGCRPDFYTDNIWKSAIVGALENKELVCALPLCHRKPLLSHLNHHGYDAKS